MVVFVEGRAKKSEYRKFKIQYDRGPNDFAMMQETLRRRLRYLRRDDRSTEIRRLERATARGKEKFNKKPDLLLIDGGKGQLSAVVEVIEELDMTGLSVAGLRKSTSGSTFPAKSEPIVLPPNSPALHLVHAHARRGAPLRRYISPAAPREIDDAVGSRRARRCRAGAQKAIADGFRLRCRD